MYITNLVSYFISTSGRAMKWSTETVILHCCLLNKIKRTVNFYKRLFFTKNLIMKDVLMCGLFFYFVQCLSELSHCIIELSTSL